jgi:hypothetical protein
MGSEISEKLIVRLEASERLMAPISESSSTRAVRNALSIIELDIQALLYGFLGFQLDEQLQRLFAITGADLLFRHRQCPDDSSTELLSANVYESR